MELEKVIKKSRSVDTKNFCLSIDGKIFWNETETIISNGRENVFYKGVFSCFDPEIGLVNMENYLKSGYYDLNIVNQQNEVILPLGKYFTKGSKIASIFQEVTDIVTIEIVFSLNGHLE